MMKKYSFILLMGLVIILFQYSCTKDYRAVYRFDNSSSTSVQIRLFSEEYGNDTITVDSSKIVDYMDLESNEDRVGLSFYGYDSICISNNSVYVVYYDDNSSNIYQTDNDSIWTVTRNKKNDYNYTYTITDDTFSE